MTFILKKNTVILHLFEGFKVNYSWMRAIVLYGYRYEKVTDNVEVRNFYFFPFKLQLYKDI